MTDLAQPVVRELTLVVPRSRVVRKRARVSRAQLEAIVLSAYDDNQRDLHGFARALVRDSHAAEDLVADAFLRLLREVDAGRTPDDIRAWLFRVTVNLVRSRGRRLQTARRFIGSLVERRTEESPETHFVREELNPELAAALQALPIHMRVAIVMAARGASGQQIAETLGRSDLATRAILTRARRRLRDRLRSVEATRRWDEQP